MGLEDEVEGTRTVEGSSRASAATGSDMVDSLDYNRSVEAAASAQKKEQGEKGKKRSSDYLSRTPDWDAVWAPSPARLSRPG